MNIKAKPVVDGKFWIVEEDGEKIGTLHKKENNKFMLSAKGGEKYFNRKDDLTKVFGKDFFETKIKTQVSHTEVREVYGFPTSCYHTIQCLMFKRNYRCLLKVVLVKVCIVLDTILLNLIKVG